MDSVEESNFNLPDVTVVAGVTYSKGIPPTIPFKPLVPSVPDVPLEAAFSLVPTNPSVFITNVVFSVP